MLLRNSLSLFLFDENKILLLYVRASSEKSLGLLHVTLLEM